MGTLQRMIHWVAIWWVQATECPSTARWDHVTRVPWEDEPKRWRTTSYCRKWRWHRGDCEDRRGLRWRKSA